jgi:hypothetical protein
MTAAIHTERDQTGVAEAVAALQKNFRKGTAMTRVLLVALTIVFQVSLTGASRADFRILDGGSLGKVLFLFGTITEQDARAFEAHSAELAFRAIPQIRLDSTGGDVDAAMKIGKLIRKYEGHTSIEKEDETGFNANCYSSWALIFIAGDWRTMGSDGGQLGLHRPYLASAPRNRQVVEKQVPIMLSQIRQYVADMGVTDNFYQQMVNTEPSEMAVYGDPNVYGVPNVDPNQAQQIHKELGIRDVVNNWKRLIPEYDPVWQEVQVSYEARAHGTTTSEMRQRQKDAEVCYGKDHTHDWLNCRDAIEWGLTERVYIERYKQTRVCSRDENETLLRIPVRERRDHPLFIQREDCIRKIMLGGV